VDSTGLLPRKSQDVVEMLAVSKGFFIGPYKTRNGAQWHNGADVHQNLPKNYLKLGNNYGIGFRV